MNRLLLFFLFLFFLFSSIDQLFLQALIFRFKATHFIAVLLFSLSFPALRFFTIPRDILLPTTLLFASMTLSALFSIHPIACFAFLAFFLFNFVFYFLNTLHFFRIFPSEIFFKVYFLSFYCVGSYALLQLIASTQGIYLPGVTQYIAHLARGQAFTYEPSYYALYMTPFTAFCSLQYFLEKNRQNLLHLLFSNLFLLSSTSTGVFFSYLFFFLLIALYRLFRFLRSDQISLTKLFTRFALTGSALFALLWVFNKPLIASGFLKFFYNGGTSHFSFKDRWRGLVEYWEIFWENPFFGTGFGAGPFYIAQKQGVGGLDLYDPEIVSGFCPMNATTEILGSLGLFGSLAFLFFLFSLLQIFRKAFALPLAEKERNVLLSLSLSICLMLMTLQFNQSIMRAYMWIHVAVFWGYARSLFARYSLLTSS